MLIVCPHCSTNYDVSPGMMGDAGRLVRCARCHQTWFAVAAPQFADAMAHADTVEAPAAAAVMDRAADPPPPDPLDPDQASAFDKPADDVSPDANPDGDGLWGVPEFPAPPLGPTTVDAIADAPPGYDIESLAARRAGGAWRKATRRNGRLRIPTVPAIIVAELAAIIAIVAWRTEIVRAMPQTASLFRTVGLPVNLRGLVFADVRISTDTHDGVTVLVVEGNIENATRAAVGVPRLRFALRNAARVEVISWTAQPDKGSLAPGEALAFRSQLASPPADGHDVVVRFLTPPDLINATR